jgi:hypothetical protein
LWGRPCLWERAILPAHPLKQLSKLSQRPITKPYKEH